MIVFVGLAVWVKLSFSDAESNLIEKYSGNSLS